MRFYGGDLGRTQHQHIVPSRRQEACAGFEDDAARIFVGVHGGSRLARRLALVFKDTHGNLC